MVNIEYKIAYSEVLEILKYISKEEFNKVPKDMLEIFKANASNNNEFVYNPRKTLQEQNVSETARTIIAILFRDYWATENQKEKILKKQNYDREKIKEEMYTTNNIFQKHNTQQNENCIKNEVSMVEYKESIFTKIKKWFKHFFNK